MNAAMLFARVHSSDELILPVADQHPDGLQDLMRFRVSDRRGELVDGQASLKERFVGALQVGHRPIVPGVPAMGQAVHARENNAEVAARKVRR